MEEFFFFLFSAGILIFGIFVILMRNPLYSALFMILCFFFTAGLYALLAAHLLMAIQILVYAGAVMVLFVFVIMLLNLKKEELAEGKITITKIIGALVLIFIFIKLYLALRIKGGEAFSQDLSLPQFTDFGSITKVGHLLLKDFLIPFELASILLLVAIIGAVIIAKKRFIK